MDIERYLLRVGGPTLVAEAVVVFAVGVCGEGVVFVGDSLLEVLAVAERILDLEVATIISMIHSYSGTCLPVRQCSAPPP